MPRHAPARARALSCAKPCAGNLRSHDLNNCGAASRRSPEAHGWLTDEDVFDEVS